MLDRGLYQNEILPPVDVLKSLSRLAGAGMGEGKTRDDHSKVKDQLFACYGIDLCIFEVFLKALNCTKCCSYPGLKKSKEVPVVSSQVTQMKRDSGPMVICSGGVVALTQQYCSE